jgi:hypothetical protein
VYSIKIAHADQRGPEVCGNVIEFAEDLHKNGVGPQASGVSHQMVVTRYHPPSGKSGRGLTSEV